MRIGLDFNGGVVNSAATKIAAAKRFLHVDLDPANTARRSLNGALDHEAYTLLQFFTFLTSEALESPPMPGALNYMAKLMEHDEELFFPTNLQPEGVQFGRQWLAEHDLDRRMLVSVGRGGNKATLLRAGFDMVVEDKGSILTAAIGVVPHRILMDAPHNRDDVLDPGIVRVSGWEELYNYIGGCQGTSVGVQ